MMESLTEQYQHQEVDYIVQKFFLQTDRNDQIKSLFASFTFN